MTCIWRGTDKSGIRYQAGPFRHGRPGETPVGPGQPFFMMLSFTASSQMPGSNRLNAARADIIPRSRLSGIRFGSSPRTLVRPFTHLLLIASAPLLYAKTAPSSRKKSCEPFRPQLEKQEFIGKNHAFHAEKRVFSQAPILEKANLVNFILFYT